MKQVPIFRACLDFAAASLLFAVTSIVAQTPSITTTTDLVMVRAGECVFLPRGVAHAVYYRSPTMQTLLIAQADSEHPVGMDTYFEQMSEPAKSMELPKDAITYVLDDPEHAMKIGVANGIILLSPEETAQRLPHYPGFGANLQGDSQKS